MTQQNTTNGTVCAEEYVVKRGDSFYLIAHKLGVPLRDLLAANSGIHPARLMVGDVLCIPREEDDSAQSGGLTGSGTTGGTGTTGGSATGTTGGASGNATGGTTGGDTSGGTTGGNTTGGASGNTTGGTTGGTSGNTSNSTTNATRSGRASGNTAGASPSTAQTSDCVCEGPGTLNCPLDEQLIIQRGQSVADVQLLNLVSRNTLATANPDIDLDSLRVGQTICVPKANIPCAVPTTYTLGVSETLEAVAVRFDLPVASILRANPCLAPQDFEQGVTVVIPS